MPRLVNFAWMVLKIEYLRRTSSGARKQSIAIGPTAFTNGQYTGPSLNPWDGDVCIKEGTTGVITGGIYATGFVCIPSNCNVTVQGGIYGGGGVQVGGTCPCG